MNRTTNNFKLGLFTLGGILVLVAAVLVFGARSYFTPTSLFETYIAGDVTGLSVGSAVEIRGVQVGKVTRIGFSWIDYQVTEPSYIVVDFVIRNDVSPIPSGKDEWKILEPAIQEGLRARVKGKGITGTSILSLEYVNPEENPPPQIPWKPRHVYIPSAPGQFMELFDSIEKTLRNLQHINFGNISQLVQGDLKSAGRVLDKADEVDFQGLSTNAEALLIELRGSNTKLKTVIADTDDTLKKIELQKLTRDMDGLVGQLQETVSKLQPGLANIDFDALNQTLDNTRRTINDMDDVLSELKRYPAGFLFGAPPPHLKEVQTPTGP
jgi:ABC-type transporter Mla subunit MlaD